MARNDAAPSANLGRVIVDDAGLALRAHVVRLDRPVEAEAAFARLYRGSRRAFWLDSSLLVEGLSRFSFMGDTSGPLSEVLTYRTGEGAVFVESYGRPGYAEPGSIFEALERRLLTRRVAAPSLPFDLVGGYVGYFGYEMKGECGASRRHRSPTPDAVWLFADRYLAIDHTAGHVFLVAVAVDDPAAATQAVAWIRRTRAVLEPLSDAPVTSAERGPSLPARAVQRLSGCRDPDGHQPDGLTDPSGLLVRSRERYLEDVRVCQEQIMAGESYEICLTNHVRLPAPGDDLAFYRRLRRCNPAPYAALLRLGADLTVFSSSPERFLRVDRRRVAESRPIKGTAPRSSDPALDEALRRDLRLNEKIRAENLMIVDLLRNDLGRVCDVGSVQVPALMITESYATVHHLVSTIRGTLRRDISTIDCVRACFPGGSMTGAPKLRTMELLDDLETEARGVYSGAIGYLGLGGVADLSIAIRTAVRWCDQLTVGAGGAVVADSSPQAEYEEMIIKALAALRALPIPFVTAPTARTLASAPVPVGRVAGT